VKIHRLVSRADKGEKSIFERSIGLRYRLTSTERNGTARFFLCGRALRMCRAIRGMARRRARSVRGRRNAVTVYLHRETRVSFPWTTSRGSDRRMSTTRQADANRSAGHSGNRPRVDSDDFAFGGSRKLGARTANLEAVPGKSCRPPLATDSPGLTDELPQVVPRSGRRHGNRRRRDTRALTRPPSPPEEERFPSSSTAGVPESILRQFHNDPRQFAMIPDREKNDGEFGSG